MKITLEDLEEKGAPRVFKNFFETTFGSQEDSSTILSALEKKKSPEDWATWLFVTYKLTGKAKQWYSSGHLEKDDNYKNGKLNGMYNYWYKDGQVWCKKIYKNGKLIEEKIR